MWGWLCGSKFSVTYCINRTGCGLPDMGKRLVRSLAVSGFARKSFPKTRENGVFEGCFLFIAKLVSV